MTHFAHKLKNGNYRLPNNIVLTPKEFRKLQSIVDAETGRITKWIVFVDFSADSQLKKIQS